MPRGRLKKGGPALPGAGRPPGAKGKVSRTLKQVIAQIASQDAEQVAAIFQRAFGLAVARQTGRGMAGLPRLSAAVLASLPGPVQAHLAQMHDQLAEALLFRTAASDLKAAYPYVELALRYNLGKPPETPFDPDKKSVNFIFLPGQPGPTGRDPIREDRVLEAAEGGPRRFLSAGAVANPLPEPPPAPQQLVPID